MGVGRPQDEGEQAVSKRPSIIGGLKLSDDDQPRTEPPAEPEASIPEPQMAASAIIPVSAPAATPAPKASGRRARPEVVHTSVYLPREVHRRLREIAFTRDVKVHDVIMEGIDAALQKHGHPSAASLRFKGDT